MPLQKIFQTSLVNSQLQEKAWIWNCLESGEIAPRDGIFCQTYLHTYVSLQMKSMIADQDKETSDEQTLSEEKDRFDDEKGKKKHGF